MKATAIEPRLLHGLAELEFTDHGVQLHRLPAWVRHQFPDRQLLAMESQPSGARLVLRTTARTVELTTQATRMAYRGAVRPRGCLDIFVNGDFRSRDVLDGGDVVEIDLETGDVTSMTGPAHTTVVTGLPPGENRVEIWLPHNESVALLELRADGPVAEDVAASPTWVHHGSSISQGSNATAPSETWPATAARRGNVAIRNLGFGGSALVDPFMARVIRDTPADYLSVKFGINVVNLDAMHLRAFVPAVHGFLDTIRDGHPETPIVVISPVFCGIHENTPGPAAIDTSTVGTGQVQFIATGRPEDRAHGRLTLEVIRRELQSLIQRRGDDRNLHYLDGTTLFGPADAVELPLPDGLHPNAAAHLRIGERFAEYAFAVDGPFRPAGADHRRA
ncbi:MAG: GDSL-type esterase/lipase family protein [Mycobacterium sp.]